MRKRFEIAVIAGDGIGPEVVDAAIPVIDAAARKDGVELAWERLPYGADHYLATGETLPDDAFNHLKDDVDAIFVGALGDPRVPGMEHARDILLGLRFRLDLYVNFRPCRLLHVDLCPLRPHASHASHASAGTAHGRQIDFVIFRENTEGLYTGRGSSKHVGTPDEEQVAEDVHTAPKVTRIIRAAFEWAKAHGKRKVTMADKSNAVPAHRLWGRMLDQVAGDFSGIEHEHFYIDALAMQLIKRPEQFEVLVTNNMFGDIISDLGSQLVGGLGVAPSANLHPGRAGLFEPVHGSAPKYAGKGTANPLATILTGALMLDDLGVPKAAERIERAVRGALSDGVRTRDLGGEASSGAMADAVLERLG